MKKPPHILFVSAFHTPFIQDDLDTLSKQFLVRPLIGHGIGQALKILWSVRRHDLVFCWFASTYASLAVMAARFFGKKSIVVIGGVDVAKVPDLEYGLFLNPWKAYLVRYALRHANRILAVDESLITEARLRIQGEGKNMECVPTGYDEKFWKPLGKKKPIVLTVAVVLDDRRVRLKGIDTLIGAARILNKTSFVAIGVRRAAVEQLNPPRNIRFSDPIPRSHLLAHYRRAKVYCQPSRREGLPNTLCEAMLSGCIPVATKVGGNVTAVQNTGHLVSPNDAQDLARAIQRALKDSARKGSQARNRIIRNFNARKRENSLLKIIGEI